MLIDNILALHGMGPGLMPKYFGDGSDGPLNTAGDVTLPATETAPVIKKYSSIQINAGHVLTTAGRCRGLILYCLGDVTIDGTIDMSLKAALYTPAVNIQPYVFVQNLTKLLAPFELVPTNTYIATEMGGTGGAGGGGQSLSGYGIGGSGGKGSQGGLFGGGAGGGGGGGGGGSTAYATRDGVGGSSATLSSANSSGGRGGNYSSTYTGGAGGAAPGGGGGGGAESADDGSDGLPGDAYGGGLVIIVAKGNVTVNAGAYVKCNGGNGGNGSTNNSDGGGGGGGGGGLIYVLHHGLYTNSGTLQVNAGGAGTGYQNGSAGMIGRITTKQI